MNFSFKDFLKEMNDASGAETKSDMIRRHREERQYMDSMSDDDTTNDDIVIRKRIRALQQRLNSPNTNPQQKQAIRVELKNEQEKLKRA